jgi:hypothetical protein
MINMYGTNGDMCSDYWLVKDNAYGTPPPRQPPTVDDSPLLPPGFTTLEIDDEIVITGPNLLTASPGGQVYFGVPPTARGPHKAITKQKKAAEVETTPPST